MSLGLIGKKCGMSRLFVETGEGIPVTLVQVEPNRVTQIKSLENDGYSAIQVTVGEVKASRVNKPETGHFAAAKVPAGRGMWEFRVDADALMLPAVGEEEAKAIELGSELTVALFSEGQKVDVTGVSKGKGFQGAVKRWNFAMQDATHGNSLSHRSAGSIGQNQTPGRVFKGKKMAGHMGNKQCTTQNLEIIKVIPEKNLLLIKGAIPGSISSDIIVKPAVKEQATAE